MFFVAQPAQARVANFVARMFARSAVLFSTYMAYPVTDEILHSKEGDNVDKAYRGIRKGLKLFPEAYKACAGDKEILKSLKNFFKSKKVKEVADAAADTVKKAGETLSDITGNSDSKE